MSERLDQDPIEALFPKEGPITLETLRSIISDESEADPGIQLTVAMALEQMNIRDVKPGDDVRSAFLTTLQNLKEPTY